MALPRSGKVPERWGEFPHKWQLDRWRKSVSYSAFVPSALNATDDIPHANIHSCLRTVGFCTPFVSNTPGLSTL